MLLHSSVSLPVWLSFLISESFIVTPFHSSSEQITSSSHTSHKRTKFIVVCRIIPLPLDSVSPTLTSQCHSLSFVSFTTSRAMNKNKRLAGHCLNAHGLQRPSISLSSSVNCCPFLSAAAVLSASLFIRLFAACLASQTDGLFCESHPSVNVDLSGSEGHA